MIKYKRKEIELLYHTILLLHGVEDTAAGLRLLSSKLQKFKDPHPAPVEVSDSYLETNLRRKLREAIKRERTEIGLNTEYVDKLARFAGLEDFKHFQNVLSELSSWKGEQANFLIDEALVIYSLKNKHSDEVVSRMQKVIRELEIQKIVHLNEIDFDDERKMVLLDEKDLKNEAVEFLEKERSLLPILLNDNSPLELADLKNWLRSPAKFQQVFSLVFISMELQEPKMDSEEKNPEMIVNGGIVNNGGEIKVDGKYIVNAPSNFNITESGL